MLLQLCFGRVYDVDVVLMHMYVCVCLCLSLRLSHSFNSGAVEGKVTKRDARDENFRLTSNAILYFDSLRPK